MQNTDSTLYIGIFTRREAGSFNPFMVLNSRSNSILISDITPTHLTIMFINRHSEFLYDFSVYIIIESAYTCASW